MKKYSKFLSKQTQHESEPNVIFILRVFLSELPFSIIRTIQALVKIMRVSKEEKHIFFCVSGGVGAAMFLVRMIIATKFKTLIVGGSILIPSIIFIAIGEKYRMDSARYGKNKTKEIDEVKESKSEIDEDTEPEDRDEEEQLKELIQDTERKVEKAEQVKHEEYRELSLEELFEQPTIDTEKILEKATLEDIREDSSIMKKCMSADLQSHDIENIMNSPSMKALRDLQDAYDI